MLYTLPSDPRECSCTSFQSFVCRYSLGSAPARPRIFLYRHPLQENLDATGLTCESMKRHNGRVKCCRTRDTKELSFATSMILRLTRIPSLAQTSNGLVSATITKRRRWSGCKPVNIAHVLLYLFFYSLSLTIYALQETTAPPSLSRLATRSMEAVSKPARPWYKRPLPLAAIAAGVVIVILVIVLPSTLLTRDDNKSSDSSSSSSSTPTSSGGSSSPTPNKTGCGNTQNVGFSNDFESQSLVSGNLTRNYSVNVPSDYNDDLEKRWPLILDFHGNSRNGTFQYNNSMFYTSELGRQYLAVYPEGVNMSWQGPLYAIEGVNDLQFTTDLLAHLNSTYCIDSSRIYASGKSNGGGFVDTLACSENGDQFAAFAMAAAALYTDNSRRSCNTSRAILEAHGLDDTTIPYSGGTGLGGDLPDVRDWVTWWSERNGCSSSARAHIDEISDASIASYTCDGNANVTQHYPIAGLGHCWPSADGENADSVLKPDICPPSLDFTSVVLEWFGNWTLQDAPKRR
nr:putative feruloyl esterase c [Quercus suber]